MSTQARARQILQGPHGNLAGRASVEQHNRAGPVNRVEVVELRSNPATAESSRISRTSASAAIARERDELVVEITDVFSPTIVARLDRDEGLSRAEIDDRRAVVDCIMVDADYNGQVFEVKLSDVPARKQDLVEGTCRLPAPREGATVAVKIIDMLGEEALITQEV